MTNITMPPRDSFDRSYFQQQADVLNIVLDHITHGMVVVGLDYRTLAFNRHFEDIFQLPPGSVEVGVDFRDILRVWAAETGQSDEMLAYALSQLDEPNTFEFEFSQLIKGQIRWCLLTHNPLPGGGFVRTFSDITKQKSVEANLLKLSREDPLTGLYNRRTLIDALLAELRRAHRYHRPLSVLMMDIDHFKKINDTWGHSSGDEVLKIFAAVCRSSLRENDKVGRWGGEEFVMFLPETAGPEAEIVAERIRRQTEAMFNHTRQPSRDPILATVSIGVATAGEEDDLETVVSRADQAMYEAKALGRNRVIRR